MTTALTPPPAAIGSNIITPPAPPIPGGNYPASRNADGTWNMYGVRIMGEFKKGDKGLPVALGADWQKRTIARHAAEFAAGFLHPLVSRHTDDPRGHAPLGYFLPTDLRVEDYFGEQMSVMVGDFVALTEPTFAEFCAGRLPYCSIENFDYEKTVINHLAVMSDMEPHFRFPMIVPRVVEGVEAAALNRYDNRAFAAAAIDSKSVFRLKREGDGKAIFCAAEFPPKKKDPAAADPAAAPPAAAAEKPDVAAQEKPEGEQAPAWAQQILALLQQIQSQLPALQQPAGMKVQPKNPTPAEQEKQPAEEEAQKKKPPVAAHLEEANVPGDDKKETKVDGKVDLEQVKLAARAAGAEDENEELKAEKAIDAKVDQAIADLKGWNVSAKTKETIRTYARMGDEALKVFVDDYKASRPKNPPKTVEKAIVASAAAAPASPDPLFGQFSDSPERLARAQYWAGMYAQAGKLSISRESYVKHAMAREDAAAATKKEGK